MCSGCCDVPSRVPYSLRTSSLRISIIIHKYNNLLLLCPLSQNHGRWLYYYEAASTVIENYNIIFARTSSSQIKLHRVKYAQRCTYPFILVFFISQWCAFNILYLLYRRMFFRIAYHVIINVMMMMTNRMTINGDDFANNNIVFDILYSRER